MEITDGNVAVKLLLAKQMAKREGVTEQLKAQDQMMEHFLLFCVYISKRQ